MLPRYEVTTLKAIRFAIAIILNVIIYVAAVNVALTFLTKDKDNKE